MDPTARWTELMGYPEEALPLDEAALLISAHANRGLNVAAQIERLDSIADAIGSADTDALCQALFVDMRLKGDRLNYDDPANSYLDQVLDRRTGIPLSLSILLMEVGRRCGAPLEGVGMPGHFLVRDRRSPELLIDAFDAGQRLDRSGCERLLSQLAGGPVRVTPAMLSSSGPRSMLARMLGNLDRSFERRVDHPSLLWVARLRLLIPGLPVGDRVQAAGRLGMLGRFDEAADALADIAGSDVDEELGARLLAEATSLRARLN